MMRRRQGLCLLVLATAAGVVGGAVLSGGEAGSPPLLTHLGEGLAWGQCPAAEGKTEAPRTAAPPVTAPVVFAPACQNAPNLCDNPRRLLGCLGRRDRLMDRAARQVRDRKPVRTNETCRDFRLDSGGLYTTSRYARGRWKADIAQADLNGDGRYDIARIRPKNSTRPVPLVLYDLDGDQRVDVIRAGKPGGAPDDRLVFCSAAVFDPASDPSRFENVVSASPPVLPVWDHLWKLPPIFALPMFYF